MGRNPTQKSKNPYPLILTQRHRLFIFPDVLATAQQPKDRGDWRGTTVLSSIENNNKLNTEQNSLKEALIPHVSIYTQYIMLNKQRKSKMVLGLPPAIFAQANQSASEIKP
jgi:hypothetical protein